MEEMEKEFDKEQWEKHMIVLRKKNVIEDGMKMYHEAWEDVTEEYKDRIKKCLEGTKENNFSLGYVAKPIVLVENNKHLVLYIHGGKNGSGEWKDYLQDTYNIFSKLTNKDIGNFSEAYLVDWKVDVADDVFDMWVGVKE